MSHVVAYTEIIYPKSCIEDGTLAAALDELGMELLVGKTNYKWYGRDVGDYRGEDSAIAQGIDSSTFGRCSHAIRLKNATQGDYEIGLVETEDGTGYFPVLDFWGSGNKLRAAVGDKGQHLGTAYNKAAIRQEARLHGYALTEEVLNSGKVRLMATRYGI